jgi:hypothetical protein
MPSGLIATRESRLDSIIERAASNALLAGDSARFEGICSPFELSPRLEYWMKSHQEALLVQRHT